ncbi:MAG: hypothetical protein JAZ11_06990 [Candidatus Thiodiazotropha lotti]|nr:hypothetical protein [Candidatus Thiodiazotropha lotti]
MSIDSRLIVCTGCDFETRELFQPKILKYRLADGSETPAHRTKGWCHDCNNYRDIEHIDIPRLEETLAEQLAEHDEAIETLHALTRNWWQGLLRRNRKNDPRTIISDTEKHIVALRSLIPALKSRQSDARCVHCGGSKIEPLDFDPDDGMAHNFHHHCGGKLRLVPRDIDPDPIRFNFCVATFILSTEGEIIEKRQRDPASKRKRPALETASINCP